MKLTFSFPWRIVFIWADSRQIICKGQQRNLQFTYCKPIKIENWCLNFSSLLKDAPGALVVAAA